MRTIILRRGAVLAMPIVVGSLLAGCSTLPFGFTEASAPAARQVQQTPPLDEIKDDLGLGKFHFRAQNYGLAELHFRRAVETQPGQTEAWVGLAASYDQLKRWELADRAYGEAIKLAGPTADILNNRGYSYLLRGDIRRASQDLSAAAAKDPANELIQNNLRTLDERARKRAA
jgi:Flp pilus assembly protein TadD